ELGSRGKENDLRDIFPSPRHPESLTSPFIYLITKGDATAENFAEKSAEILRIVEAAVSARISFIQIREKRLPARFVFELTEKAAKLARNSQTKILVNDRADIALSAGADGVHLTSLSLSAETIRQNFPKDFIVGVSAHTLAEAETASRQGADFVTFSPIFHSPDKGEPKGLSELKKICAALKPFPVLALGGVDETNYKSTLEAGASGFAAIRFLNEPENLGNI
ncbi:MAG: thiamine phosphate synthase, partial [Acidobacteriota bacterium]|nr:thiamine phosphate synthase [Acidobacteriota bacterium]